MNTVSHHTQHDLPRGMSDAEIAQELSKRVITGMVDLHILRYVVFSVVFERGVRAWCTSVVFEHGVRAWCSSAKREKITLKSNFNHVTIFSGMLNVTQLTLKQHRYLQSLFLVDPNRRTQWSRVLITHM